MNLDQIFQKVLVRSGQFLLSIDGIELNPDNFKELLEDALKIYNEQVPVHDIQHYDFNSTRNKTFIESDHDLGIPDNVLDAIPVGLSGINPLNRSLSDNCFSSEVKRCVNFVYRKPVLTVPFNSTYEVSLLFFHKLIEYTDPYEGTISYKIDTISSSRDGIFFDIVRGMFMLGIGRSRRAFTLNDLPITMDA